MIKALLVIVLFFIPSILSATQLSLSRDANGWTVFVPSDDSRIMYISTSGDDGTAEYYDDDDVEIGTDPFNPDGPINAFATYAAAYANTRDGYPDWILIRRGDTFVEAIDTSVRSGRDVDEPFLISSYGNSGMSPLFKTGSEDGVAGLNGVSWVAVSGIDFYAHTRDPDSVDYVNTDGGHGFNFQPSNGYTTQGILLEGCKFRFFKNNAFGAETNSTGVASGATIRRCVISNTYIETGHTQGIWSWHGDNLIVEDSVIDHNGWYSLDGSGKVGEAEALSHNTYMASVQNVTFRNNIISRPSNSGNKFTAEVDSYGLKLINNLYIDSEIGISAGVNFPENVERFISPEIRDNVLTLTGLTQPTGTSAAWGIWLGGWSGGYIDGNLFIDNDITNNNSNNNSNTIRFQRISAGVSITDNVSLGQQNGQAPIRFVAEQPTDECTNITVSGNMFECNGTYSNYVDGSPQPMSELTFSNNSWYNATTTGFTIDSATYTEAQWLASVEPTASFSQPVYPDRTRNVATYMNSIGETATVEAFIAAARNQDRYNWDPNIMALSANSWIRAGFGITTQNHTLYNASARLRYSPSSKRLYSE